MMFLRLFFKSALATLSLQAQLEPTYLKKLREAKTHSAIVAIQREFAEIGQQKRICQIQMQQKSIPAACYRAMNLEKKWKLVPTEKADALIKRLDEACESSAQAALKDETEPLEIERHLSGPCAKAISKADEIRRYRSSEIFSKNKNGAEFDNPDWL
jgi:hypothetical protein